MASALTKAATQAQLQAQVKYTPALSALSRALQDLRSQYIGSTRSAKASAAGITLAASRARPVVQKTYGDAQDTRVSAQRVLDARLAALGPAANDYKAASAVEASGARGRLGDAQAYALQDLTNREQSAAAGQAWGINNARATYLGDRAKTQQQIQDTLQQSGDYSASAAQTIADQIRRDATTRRGQTLGHDATVRGQDLSHADRAATLEETAAHHRETEANAAGKPKKKGKPKLTQDQRQHRYDQVSYAQSKVQQLLQADHTISRHELAEALKGGRAIKDDKGHVVLSINPVGELWTSVALDLALDHHVSARNVAALRRLGINPRGPRGDWQITPPPAPSPLRGVPGIGAHGTVTAPTR